MFKNYIISAWRNITHSKFYSIINISGLALGLATGIMVLLWTQNEKRYDRFNHDYENIYRINTQFKSNGKTITWDEVPAPLAGFAASDPKVKSVVRIFSEDDDVISNTERTKVLSGFDVAFVDSSFFSIFNYKLLYGSKWNSLNNNHSVIITQQTALKFFGSENAVGKSIQFENESFTITGILKNFPENSSLKYDAIFPMAYFAGQYAKNSGNGSWRTIDEDFGNFNYRTFIKVFPKTDINNVNKALTTSFAKAGDSERGINFFLQPLKEIHLIGPDGNESALHMVEIFVLVAILLLFIAGINYINLSTARALTRAKEVSVRKIIGAGKTQLFIQFLTETGLLFFIATCVAILLIYLLMPLYNGVSGKELIFSLSDIYVWRVVLIAILGTLAAASIYPALLLSSFRPISSLKGKIGTGRTNTSLRKGLVIFQFTVSVILIVSTLVINRQMKYVMQRNLGYDKSYVFTVPLPGQAAKHTEAIKNELSNDRSIENVSFSNIYNIANIQNSTSDLDWKGRPDNFSINITEANVDKYFIPTMKLKLIEGNNFTGSPADSTHYIVNEKAANLMGLKAPFVGQIITLHEKEGTIIGVINDFNFKSMKQEIGPLIFTYSRINNILYVRAKPNRIKTAVEDVEKVYKAYSDNNPFSYSFIDKQFENLYHSDLQTGLLFSVFASIAIFISCLGLLGLATYTAQVRTKEIGVRKVLGASATNIVRLISSDFIKLIFISLLIAIPVSWFLMSQWLHNYVFRISLDWVIFFVAAFVATIIAIGTSSFQAVRAALANPVDSLRTE